MKKAWRIIFFNIFFISNSFAQEINMDTTHNVMNYIYINWDVLTRNNSDYFKTGATNSNVLKQKNILYISKNENIDKVRQELKQQLTEEEYKKVRIEILPADLSKISEHGLLYLPYSYVVPGGMFNEMYAWDSYFIELGLIRHGRLELAKNMVENIIYEINYYGTILNANRTYFIKRSNPPLLTRMIFAYYEKTQNKAWLKSTLSAINKLYNYWTTPPRLIPEIGLSRYCAGGKGATPEELPSYYEKVKNYYKNNKVLDYDKNMYYNAEKNELTPLFYIADRTVRESGFDLSSKFGIFGAPILDYAPVDLNVLLYQLEKDTSQIYGILEDKENENIWLQRATKRSKLIDKYMWDDKLGYYFDYNFKSKMTRPYIYATTLYPLWAGIASKDQAEKIVDNISDLLAPGGIVTSTTISKFQWDAPFGWAPLQYFAVKGLANYGHTALAQDIAKRFIKTINVNFEKTHLIHEKYDVQTLSISSTDKINYGYNTNETGFGWTNGVYLELAVFVGLLNNDVDTPIDNQAD